MEYSIEIQRKRAGRRWLNFLLLILGIVWIIAERYWIGIIHILLAMTGFFVNRSPVIFFSEEGITYPALIKRIYNWRDISHAILKDDILTIDLKNNHIIQHNITPSSSAATDEITFNEYCQMMISQADNQKAS